MIKAGLVSVSFRKNSPREILSAMADAGLSYIEWGSDVHAPWEDFDMLSQIVSLQKEYGIKTSSYGTYFRIGKDAPQDISKYICAAKRLGTNILRLWCGERGSEFYSKEERYSVISDCKRLSEIAQTEDVVLCLEFHPNTLTDTWESTLDILQTVDSPNFRTYWQPNQFKSEEYNLESIQKLAPYIENLHVFNWDEQEHFPLSGAVERWKNYISFLNGNQTALLEFMPDNNIESLKTEAKALREILE